MPPFGAPPDAAATAEALPLGELVVLAAVVAVLYLLVVGDEEGAGVAVAAAWMVLVSVLLFWLPGIGAVIAGFVGGQKAGTVGRAVLAALLPALLAGAAVFALGAGLSLPVIGALLGAMAFALAGVHSLGLLVGAVLGAVLS